MLQGTGIIVTPYVAAYVNLYDDRDDLPENIEELVKNHGFDAAARDPDHFTLGVEGYLDVELAMEILEELGIECTRADAFTGTATSLSTGQVSQAFQGEDVIYIPASKPSTVFNAGGYEDIDEIATEFRNLLGDILPGHFDYVSALVDLKGTRQDD